MKNKMRFAGAVALICGGVVAALSGCVGGVSEPEPAEGVVPFVNEPALEVQSNDFCCYASCGGSGWKYVGQPEYGKCRAAAKSYCAGLNKPYTGADWRPCP